MNDAERMRVLELLEQGKITAAEAADLLNALGGGQRGRERDSGRRSRAGWDTEREGGRPRWFKVRVTDTASGRVRTDFSVPLPIFGGFGMGFAHRLKKMHINGGIDDLMDAVRSGRRGTVYDVTSDDGGQRIEISVD